jgi:hypothetical protein
VYSKLKRSLYSFAILAMLSSAFPAEANPVHAPLPADVAMNKDAGRGGYLFLSLRLENGQKLLFLVDTGSPITLFAKSIKSKLGKRVGTISLHTLYGNQKSGAYAAPRIYLGETPLLTGSNVYTWSPRLLSLRARRSVEGILGMDCLRHYCIQLDFKCGTVRFLDSDHLDAGSLGKAYPMTFSGGHPLIHHQSLVPGRGFNSEIDTGCHIDGFVEKKAINAHWWNLFVGKHVRELAWDGQDYTHLVLCSREGLNLLGLRFLARHLVTLDFPKQTIYLKQTRVGPLP